MLVEFYRDAGKGQKNPCLARWGNYISTNSRLIPAKKPMLCKLTSLRQAKHLTAFCLP